MDTFKNKNSHTVATVMRVIERINQVNYTKKSSSFKSRLTGSFPMAVDEYYRSEFPKLRRKGKWAKVNCPFHDDRTPSLSINLDEGHFKCHACGAKGGGIVKFHAMRYNMPYREAFSALQEVR